MVTVEQLQGLWLREWIEVDTVRCDDKRVSWIQAGDWFVDIRIPLRRPEVTAAKCLANLATPVLTELLDAEGFAGTISLQRDVCTWRRDINWHGPPTEPDVGRLSFNSDGDLLEDGVYASYRELWKHHPVVPQRVYQIQSDTITGIIVLTESQFFSGLSPILTQNNTQDKRVDIQARFLSEYATGCWDGAAAIATQCTNPFRENQIVFSQSAERWIWRRQLFDGSIVPTVLPMQLLWEHATR